MSTVYARVPHASDDPGGGVVGRPKWSVENRCRTHGRQVPGRRMYTDQDTNRSGIKGTNSVALRAVLRYRQILPQRGKGIRGGDSARHGGESHPQPGGPCGCPGAEERGSECRHGFDSQSRKSAEAAREQAQRDSASRGESRKCTASARRGPCGRNASNTFARRWLRNGRRRKAPHFTARRIQCASTDSI